ncbi:MAG: alkaline phosphatase PhoX [Gemmatimonadales bacterium]
MLDRRQFLGRSALAGGALIGIEGLMARGGLRSHPLPGMPRGDYGDPVPARADNTGEWLLALPPGFRYTAFGRTGEPMADGRPTPPSHDGMAAFAHAGKIRLVRNHEVQTIAGGPVRAIGDATRSYDPACGGGTTTVVVDPATRLPERTFVSLSGTNTNCAGGPTPWGSWISCEEIVIGTSRGLSQKHGYCFEVPASADAEVEPVPLRAMGRFVHEAVAVDPATGIVYETEDALTAGFYRFQPSTRDRLAAGGRLQMLAVQDRPGYDTRRGQAAGVVLPVRWVDIGDPDPANAEQDRLAVYHQGVAQGAATFGRLEGCFHGAGRIYLNSTNGGDAGLGQVWEYRPVGGDGGQLRLVFESDSPTVLNAPDNICMSPRGGLVLCEDHGGGDMHLRGLTRDGRVFDFARNIVPDHETSEFAGSTFSPDGTTLFVNIQTPGITFAIWGPWAEGAL